MGGWGVAPLARSTPTRAQRGTRPKNYQNLSHKNNGLIFANPYKMSVCKS
ncbi:MAG: hypothetical protein NZ455_06475 [Bacteroidia bacterium]|nr:hypothetical protein [Bacteroidia bacterium]